MARWGNFEVLAERWMREHAKVHKRSWRIDRRILDRGLLPAFGSLPVNKITPELISAWHAGLVDKPTEANRRLEVLSSIFSWALRLRLVKENPASFVRHFTEEARDRVLSIEELRALVAALQRTRDARTRTALWLLLLTGARRSEVIGARWTDVDWDNRLLKVPAHRSKSKKRLRYALPSVALTLLREYGPQPDGWLFPSYEAQGTAIRVIERAWQKIREEAGLKSVRIHDLRRTMATYAADMGVPLAVLKDMLNHSTLQATQVYARALPESVQSASEHYAERITELAAPLLDAQVTLNAPQLTRPPLADALLVYSATSPESVGA